MAKVNQMIAKADPDPIGGIGDFYFLLGL